MDTKNLLFKVYILDIDIRMLRFYSYLWNTLLSLRGFLFLSKAIIVIKQDGFFKAISSFSIRAFYFIYLHNHSNVYKMLNWRDTSLLGEDLSFARILIVEQFTLEVKPKINGLWHFSKEKFLCDCLYGPPGNAAQTELHLLEFRRHWRY